MRVIRTASCIVINTGAFVAFVVTDDFFDVHLIADECFLIILAACGFCAFRLNTSTLAAFVFAGSGNDGSVDAFIEDRLVMANGFSAFFRRLFLDTSTFVASVFARGLRVNAAHTFIEHMFVLTYGFCALHFSGGQTCPIIAAIGTRLRLIMTIDAFIERIFVQAFGIGALRSGWFVQIGKCQANPVIASILALLVISPDAVITYTNADTLADIDGTLRILAFARVRITSIIA
jgi:hypothetical protein